MGEWSYLAVQIMTNIMKKIIISVACLTAITIAVVHADTAKNAPAKDCQKSSTCSAKSAEQEKGGCCPLTSGKSGCKGKQNGKQTSLPSPKAADAGK
jgi:hypothetical protein